MFLGHVRARRFRNLGDVRIDPGPRVSVLFGENAQGKTNVVEAIHLLSTLQSFRTRRTSDLIQSGFSEAIVEGELQGRNGAVRLQIHLDGNGKTARVDGKSPPSTSSYLSEFHSVLFSPADIDLARGSQDLRRRYLDRATFWRDPAHLARLRDYNRALRHRNACLRCKDASIVVWDDQLAQIGAAVHSARRETIEEILPDFRNLHQEVSGGEDAELALRGTYGAGGDTAAILREILQRNYDRDVRMGYTTVGPHRDTVRLKVAGHPVERFASQGQMRTLALSLKLSLLVWGCAILGQSPVFLLDDPGSELDHVRLGHLARFLENWPGQVIIAAAARDSLPVPDPAAAQYFCLRGGSAAAA